MAMLNKFAEDYVRDMSQQSRNNNDRQLSEGVVVAAERGAK
ncbi:hypothetical protein [Nocardia sp. NPDC004604]